MPCRLLTHGHTDGHTDRVTTVGTLSGFKDFFLQPIIKDLPNIAKIDRSVLDEMDVEGCWLFIKSKLQEAIDLFIPIEICTDKVKDKPPWMSHRVKKSVEKKYLLFKMLY